MTRDLEYLQQMYPVEAKKYQKVIVETLDRLDYEGSMIYDEYPDRWQIYRLTQVIVDKIRKMEAEETAEQDGGSDTGESGTDSPAAPKDWERITEFVQVLLSYEIYKKRHTNRNGILKF